MYNFIFYFIYKRKIGKEGYALTRYSSCMIVALAIGIHIDFLYSILRFLLCYYKHMSIARSGSASFTLSQQFLLLLFLSGVFILTCLYFRSNRISIIEKKYGSVDNFYSVKNAIKFLLIFILPFLISIFLVNKSVKYCS